MSHEIDMTTGRAAMAYAGSAPWHRLGQKLTPEAGLDVWAREAGLDYEVKDALVRYGVEGELREFHGRRVLYRADTRAPLSVVSKDYRVVQPADVMEFFAQLSEAGGFHMETAGALSDGKRIWALARAGAGASVIGQDEVRPYVLLATSYDGTLATTAKFTAIRVVCNNTMSMSVGAWDGQRYSGKAEIDTEGGAVSSLVRIPHSARFDPRETRLSLGIVGSAFERWLVETRLLAERALSDEQAENFAERLVGMTLAKPKTGERSVRESKPFSRLMELYGGGLIGAEFAGEGNRWRMLNAVTELVDHHRGRSDDTRLASAWFGEGSGLKDRAFAMLASNDEFAEAA